LIGTFIESSIKSLSNKILKLRAIRETPLIALDLALKMFYYISESES
jgi:hypothetical protein